MFRRVIVNVGGKLRRGKLHGRNYLVAPAASLQEGVWNGSGGPIFYPAFEISKSRNVWNNKPVVVYHPKVTTPQGDEFFVAAGSPEVLEASQVGVVLNSTYDDKLRHEFWFDEDRLKSVNQKVYRQLRAEKPIEVSTGLDMDFDEEPGVHNEKPYDKKGKNFRPDHVAILPDIPGAYSIKDGGGVFVVNQVYEYRASDTVDKDDPVARLLEEGSVVVNTIPEEKEMAESNKFDRKAHIAALIGNGWEEVDRSELEKLPDAQLQKIKPVEKTPEPKKEEPPVGNEKKQEAPPKNVEIPPPPAPPKFADLLAAADPATQTMFANMRKSLEREVNGLVEVIVANENNKFTKEYLTDLGNKDLEQLRGMAALARNDKNGQQIQMFQADYSGMAGAPVFNAAGGAGYGRPQQDQFLDLPSTSGQVDPPWVRK